MARIILTRALAQQTDGMLEHQVMRGDVRSALEQLIDRYPHLRQVLLNDRSHLREHINVFVNDELVGERVRLVDAVGDGDTVFVLQSVSGGATRSVEMVANTSRRNRRHCGATTVSATLRARCAASRLKAPTACIRE